MHILTGLAALFSLATIGAGPATRPYSGLTLRDDESGSLLVTHIAPGPLGGRGFTSPHLQRGDTILSINGRPMRSIEFDALQAASRIGDEVVFEVKRTGSSTVTAVPTAGAEGALETLRFKLDAASNWVGPVDFPNAVPFEEAMESLRQRVSPEAGAIETYVDAQLARQNLAEPVDTLSAFLASVQAKKWGSNALSHVAFGFRFPKRLPQLQHALTDPLPAIAADPGKLFAHAATLLDVNAPEAVEPLKAGDLDALARALDAAGDDVARAFAGIEETQRGVQREQIVALLRHVATPKLVESSPRAPEFTRAMQTTMSVDYQALLIAANRLAGVLQPTGEVVPSTAPATQPVAIPELREAVTGEIVAVRRCGMGWIVVGGTGANTYDLSRLVAVIDFGGDDVYRYPEGARPSVQVVVDHSGDDQYFAEGEFGPASAVMGVSLLHDLAGDDLYSGKSFACGVGVMGVGVLLDRAGDDRYEGSAWSDGAGVYGVGAIIDLAGGDTYVASIDSQAIGGPKGFGLILDADGGDVYRVNGPIPSVYDTPAVAYAMSQGAGLGFRRFDSGGIGILEDLAGNDRYEGGEFSQGGGYYFSLGLLHDRAGSDLYYGNRYSQAFAAHQAIGILVDDVGDDTYYAMTAANQSGAWDQSITLLLDKAGNDTYRGDGLAQGSAAMQAIAWLVDLSGNDHYVAAGSATQGQSGSNEYGHWLNGAFSWSLLLDAGGADFYSSGRKDGQTTVTGARNDAKPESSDLSGLFIDDTIELSVP